MQLERLRLAGFKSFVEPAELAIGPGLTGIVGPNGCGKSNLVEALRWVMGEASARRLRGGEMDDVIFAGSSARPSRNIAEVSLTIDNSGRDAPGGLNDRDTIEVTRRIERKSGSAYRINGREARARDVQLLFADAATGPHSGALIGQGRIGALVDAKPGERRLLLDEAAGTAGLHARRHEAELKLKAAEDNLLRLDDVIATLSAQLETLNKQAKQAQRYRRLGEQIRRAEAQMLDARWHAAAAEADGSPADLRDGRARGRRRDRARRSPATACASEAEAELPPLRLAEAAAGAAVQRITHAREALEQELARAVAARAEAERRLTQIAADIARESAHLADGDAALTRLADERHALERAQHGDDSAIGDATARLDEAAAQLGVAETGLLQMIEACAPGVARRAAHDRERRGLADRRARLDARQARAASASAPRSPASRCRPKRLRAQHDAAAAAAAEIETRRGEAADCAPTLGALPGSRGRGGRCRACRRARPRPAQGRGRGAGQSARRRIRARSQQPRPRPCCRSSQVTGRASRRRSPRCATANWRRRCCATRRRHDRRGLVRSGAARQC